jgi:hypothetical protein
MSLKTLKSVFAAALLAVGFTLSASVSHAGTFNLDMIVTSQFDISNIFVYTSGPAFTSTGPFSATGNDTSPIFIDFPFPDPASDYHVLLLGVVASGSHTGGLAVFSNTSFAGQSPPPNEATLVGDLTSNNGDSSNLTNFVFNSGLIGSDGIVPLPGNGGTITAFSNGEDIGNLTVINGATPLPAALPLFATGLGALGLLGWRRKRKAQGVA